MRRLVTGFFVLTMLAGVGKTNGEPVTLEPDDYADGTSLHTIIPQVTLWTLNQDNERVPLYEVRSTIDALGYAPTGDQVFSRAGVTFWDNSARLEMDFTTPVTMISIDFAGGTFAQTEIGQLEIYDAGGGLIDTYLTQPRGAGEVEKMQFTRPQGDIASAIAYVADGNGTFGRLDNLSFVPIPEPSTLMLLCVGAVSLFACVWREFRQRDVPG